MLWIILGVIVYVIIGVCIFIDGLKAPWGEFLLPFAPLIIFGYPFLWILNLYQRRR